MQHAIDNLGPATARDPQPTTSNAIGPTALRCSELVRRFGDHVAVDGVSFAVEPGETYGLLGPNGAGKTTVIRMICGLLHRHGGRIRLAGDEVDDHDPSIRRQIGYVPQDLALYPDLSARENLRFFGGLYGLPRKQLRVRVDKVPELLGLTDRGDDRVESFSGGMKRRLNIGAALVHEPRLLILDEPTVGVDPQSRHAILEAVDAFGEHGMAVLYTTHYMEEAERICDRIGIIDHGRLIAQGTRNELVAFVHEQDRIDLVIKGDAEDFAAACAALEGVLSATPGPDGVQVIAEHGHRLVPGIFHLAEQSGTTVRSVNVVEPDLETVFLHLTGTALRE